MATLAEAGAEMLLLEAWHVSVAPKSSRLTWGTDRVFWTVCPNVFSKLESIKWLSRHQVTWGMGSPKNRKRKKKSHFIERKNVKFMFDHVCMTLGFFTELKLRYYYIWGAFHAKRKKKMKTIGKKAASTGFWVLCIKKLVGRSMNYVMQLRSNKGLFILNVSFEIFSNGQ